MRTLFSNRLLAYLIDLTIIVLVIWFFREVVFGGFNLPSDINDPVQAAFYFFTLQTNIQQSLPSAILIVTIIYIIIPSYVWKGQTIGKKITGSKVVNLDGSNVNPVQITIRTMLQTPLLILIIWYATSFMPSPFTFILFMTTSLIAYILYVVICAAMVHSREDYSSVHDMVFNTIVVDSTSTMADVIQQTRWIRKMMEDDSFKLYKDENEEDEDGVMKFNKSSFHLIRGYKKLNIIRGSENYNTSFKVLHRGPEPKDRIIVNKGLRPDVKDKYDAVLSQVHKEIMLNSNKSLASRELKIRKAWEEIEKARIKKEETMIIERDKRMVIAQQKIEAKVRSKEAKKELFQKKIDDDELKKLELLYKQDAKDQARFERHLAKDKTQVIKKIDKAKYKRSKKEGVFDFEVFKTKDKEMSKIKNKRKKIISDRKLKKAQKKKLKEELRLKNLIPKEKDIEKGIKKLEEKKKKPKKIKAPKAVKPKKIKPIKVVKPKKVKPIKVVKPKKVKVKKTKKVKEKPVKTASKKHKKTTKKTK